MKQNENQECESDGSQKSIWKQVCQENVAEGSRAGGGGPAPRLPGPRVAKAAGSGRSQELRYSGGLPEAAGEARLTRNWSRGVGVPRGCTCASGELERPDPDPDRTEAPAQELGPPTRPAWGPGISSYSRGRRLLHVGGLNAH